MPARTEADGTPVSHRSIKMEQASEVDNAKKPFHPKVVDIYTRRPEKAQRGACW